MSWSDHNRVDRSVFHWELSLMSDEFEIEIRIWSDNKGKATSDAKTRIKGESEWQAEPTLSFNSLADTYQHLRGFFGMMEEVERTIVEPMFGKAKSKGELN